MSEMDGNSLLDATIKEDQTSDPLVEPNPVPDDDTSTCFTDNYGPPLEDHEIGPEDALFRVQFRVVKTQFQFQRITKDVRLWIVRANTRNEMLDNLWQLTRRYVRRPIDFPALNDPCWSEKEIPDRTDLPNFVVIRDNTSKKSIKVDQVNEDRWRKWTVQSNLMLLVYLHGHQVHSRAAWELVVDRLLRPGSNPRKPTLVGEELKLDIMLKRLTRLHKDRLIPKREDSFELWARWILKAPTKRHSSLSMSMPPGDLMKNFVPIKVANGEKNSPERRPPSKRTRSQLISGPAQREHTTDGFGFEDEVKILRQTVTQIRDLVEMLDHRVGLLEEKCQGFKQTVQSGQTAPPPRKARKVEDEEQQEKGGSGIEENDDDDEEDNTGFDDEPQVNEEERDSDGGDDWVKPDPLLFNDLIEVKEETYEDT